MSAATPGHRFHWNSTWFLAVVAVFGLATIVAGVGYGGALFRPSGQSGPPVAVSPGASPAPSTSPSPGVSPSQSPSLLPTPPATPAPGQAAWGILVKDFRPAGGGNYIVTLVDANGAVAARATPANRTHPAGVLVQMSNISASDSTLYYLDGDSTIKFLKPNGATGTVRSLTVNADSAVVFAVSPDDVRIAVAIITFLPSTTRLFVEDLAGGNHIDLPTPSSDVEWPVGWHQGRLVLGVGTNSAQTPYDGYAYGPMGYRIVDASTGDLLGTVCPIRSVMGSPVPAGTICIDSDVSYLVSDWAGATRSIPSSHGSSPGVLSPDGALVADDGYAGMMRLIDRYGTVIVGAHTATPLGWIDNANFVARAPSGPLSVFRISTEANQLSAGWLTGIMASGFFAGRIPGGL